MKLFYWIILVIKCARRTAMNMTTAEITTKAVYNETMFNFAVTLPSQQQPKVLNLAYLVPYTHGWPVGEFLASGIIAGIEEIHRRQLLPGYDVRFIWRDSWCQPLRSMKIQDLSALRQLYPGSASLQPDTTVFGQVTVEMWQQADVLHGMVGEGCSSACERTGLLAAIWNLPFIAIRCLSGLLSDKQVYPTFSRVVGTVETTAPVYNALAATMGWDRVGIIRDENAIYKLMADSTELVMEQDNRIVYSRAISSTVSGDVLNKQSYAVLHNVMLELKRLVRVIYIFAYADDMRNALIIAREIGMMNGEYAFVGSSFGPTVNKVYQYKPEIGPELYDGMLNRENWTPIGPEWDEFSLKVIDHFSDPTFNGWPKLKPGDDPSLVNLYAGMIHDAVLVWAYGMNKTLQQGHSPENGLKVTENIFNLSFAGITGPVSLNELGDRLPNYEIDIVQNGVLIPIYEWKAGENILRKTYRPEDPNDWTGLVWPGNASRPPSGVPGCGWDGGLCGTPGTPDSKPLVIGVASSVAIVFTVTIVVAGCLVRKFRWEAELKEATSYLISWCDVTVQTSTAKSTGTLTSVASGEMLLRFTEVVKYHNDKAAVKRLSHGHIDINRCLLVDLKVMKDMKHENLNPFIGICAEVGHECILMLYAQRGSLQDVISDQSVELTWDFKISLAVDVANGMKYLHNTDICCHGHLTSSNCVVDGRWTCKITDFGLKTMKQNFKPEGLLAETLLWTAPELLRSESMKQTGTKKGDVFSYGIIVQEICLFDIPYAANVPFQEAKDIVSQVMSGKTPLFRPTIPLSKYTPIYFQVNRSTADPRGGRREPLWLQMMEHCWAEDPDLRPHFSKILEILKEINGGKNMSLVDNMINRLENHTKNLEDIIMERTKALHEEKVKVEMLLMELLPKSVAESLKYERQVAPEFFDEVTIFFSDIVGFTRISAAGTPLDVVRMLNLMYTLFDDVSARFDVYKVATIGDAYFVASGVPLRNGKKHAEEICDMALALLVATNKLHIPHIPHETLKLRIGVHTGSCVAGVTGQKMPRYLLFGDTVDIASKMESSGEAMRIQLSQTTVEIIQNSNRYFLEHRGKMSVKGYGEINTFWLTGNC